MRSSVLVVFLATIAVFASAQAPSAPPPAEACQKNISFAVAEGGQPVPDVPKFASKWIAKKSRPHDYPGLCFSQIPSSSMNNYVVVLSSSEVMFEGLSPSAHTYTSATAASAGAAATASYGGTWSYSYVGVPSPTTTSTTDLGRDDKPKSLYARVYNQQGKIIARYTPVGGFFARDRLLESVMAAVRADTLEAPKQRPVAAPLSVYYINCNVDDPVTQTAAASPPSDPPPAPPQLKPAPPPPPSLDFWSSPAGADIYLDGNYIGRTPYSQTVPPGEHIVTIRKRDFGMWEERLNVLTGKRKVSAYLEQKSLTLQ
jgi:hypothetical protein